MVGQSCLQCDNMVTTVQIDEAASDTQVSRLCSDTHGLQDTRQSRGASWNMASGSGPVRPSFSSGPAVINVYIMKTLKIHSGC